MLTEDGKAMLARSVREYLKKYPGKKADAKKRAIRHFMDYRMAFGGGKASDALVQEVERYIDRVMSA
ncbi:MAG TPA: hypothetical protein PKJ15_05235 [Methanomassiliicoccales archaeon]|nr:hypothetical protein [Methanomassiliicoccales archaeon]